MIVLPEFAGDQYWGRPVSARASVRAPEGPLEESPESFGLWTAPGGSVAAPERSGKVAGGFGSVSNRIRRDFVMIL